LEGLNPDHRRDLLLALISQLDLLLVRLRHDQLRGEALEQRWQQLQPELRRVSLRAMAGEYVQLPQQGGLLKVAESLTTAAQLEGIDPELPAALPMLGALVQAQPLLVEGRLLPPDEPKALLQLEALISNWLIRNAELISAEVLACCSTWPELRRYLLRTDLLPTRNLERLRNQLNAQQRWSTWFERPVQLYESQRLLYRLDGGAIAPIRFTEPRDAELRQLSWGQQLVTLALEARDALAPQLQAALRQPVAGVGGLTGHQQQHRRRLPALLQQLQFALEAGGRHGAAHAPEQQLHAAGLGPIGAAGGLHKGVAVRQQALEPFAQQGFRQDQQRWLRLLLRHRCRAHAMWASR
ncbi:MAG: DUF3685 domain-containing protein, partial [Vulcanococcus sp.]